MISALQFKHSRSKREPLAISIETKLAQKYLLLVDESIDLKRTIEENFKLKMALSLKKEYYAAFELGSLL